MPTGGLHLNFATGAVHVAGIGFPNAATAVLVLKGMVREIERFGRAVDDGIRTETSYRLWAAAEEAPPSLAAVR